MFPMNTKICHLVVAFLIVEYVTCDDALEMNDYVGRFLERRVKRKSDDLSDVIDDHVSCKQQNIKSCCGKSNIFKHFGETNKTLAKACYADVSQQLKEQSQDLEIPNLFSCEKFKMLKKLHYCVYECIGKGQNLLKPDGSLNVESVKAYMMDELFEKSWQKEIGVKALDKCFAEKFATWPENEPGLRCDPIAVQFQYCVWKEFETNCPESERKDSKKCNKLRSRLNQKQSAKRN